MILAPSLSLFALYPLTEHYRPEVYKTVAYNMVYSISEYQKHPSLSLQQVPDRKHHNDSLTDFGAWRKRAGRSFEHQWLSKKHYPTLE